MRSKGRRDGPRSVSPEAADLGFFEDVISTQHFVRPFARHDYFESAVVNQFREQEQRRRRGTQNRLLGMPDNFRECLGNVGMRAPHIVVPCLQESMGFFLVPALVELGILKTNGKGPELIAHDLPGQRGNQCGIQATAQVASHWDVGSQADAGGVAEQVQELLTEALLMIVGEFADGGEREAPILPDSNAALFQH